MYSPPGLHRPGHSLHLPTNVWGAQDHESPVWSHVVGWPPLLPCARRPIVHLRRKGPYGSVNSECEPVVHRRAVCGSERLEVVLETIHPILLCWASLSWIFPPDEFSVHQPLREAPGGLSGHGSREQKSPLSNGSFHALAPCLLEGLSVRKLSVGAAYATAKPRSSASSTTDLTEPALGLASVAWLPDVVSSLYYFFNRLFCIEYASMTTLFNFQFPESHKIIFWWDTDVGPKS